MINYNYKISQGYECLSASLGNIIGYSNPEVTASAIVFLGDGMKVGLNKEDKVIGSDIFKSSFNFLLKYQIEYLQSNVKDVNNVLQFLCEMLDEKIIPIIKVKPNKLTYHGVFSQAVSETHNVNIAGYDSGRLYICDGYVPARVPTTFEGWVDKEMIIEAFKEKKYEYIKITDASYIENRQLGAEIKDKIKVGIEEYILGGG